MNDRTYSENVVSENVVSVVNYILRRKALRALSTIKQRFRKLNSFLFFQPSLLRRWFDHMIEVKPNIYVTYNGDFFDW